jgi:hypothetical protein
VRDPGDAFTVTDDADGRLKLDAPGPKLLVADGAGLDFATSGPHEIKFRVEVPPSPDFPARSTNGRFVPGQPTCGERGRLQG